MRTHAPSARRPTVTPRAARPPATTSASPSASSTARSTRSPEPWPWPPLPETHPHVAPVAQSPSHVALAVALAVAPVASSSYVGMRRAPRLLRRDKRSNRLRECGPGSSTRHASRLPNGCPCCPVRTRPCHREVERRTPVADPCHRRELGRVPCALVRAGLGRPRDRTDGPPCGGTRRAARRYRCWSCRRPVTTSGCDGPRPIVRAFRSLDSRTIGPARSPPRRWTPV